MKQFALALFLLSTSVMANPGSATRYLINEPASLLDIGIMRLDIVLSSLQYQTQESFRRGAGSGGEESGLIFYPASYILTDDLLNIEMYVVRAGGDLEKACKTAIGEVKGWLSLILIQSFQHSGYSMKNEPESLRDNLNGRTQVGCRVVDDNLKDILFARSRLTEDAVFITKNVE